MAGFFGNDTFEFLAELKKNNKRDWFNKNKDRFEASVKEPFLEFINAVGPELRKINRNIVADSRPVGGSLFRIYRDVRFAKDKSPYKTHAGAHFPVGGKDVHGPGYYFHIEPGESFVGAGIWMPDSKTIKRIRDAIVAKPGDWVKAQKVLNESEGEKLKRPPKGYDADHRFIEDLKRKSFTGGSKLTKAQITSPDFMKTFIRNCRQVTPLVAFLARAVKAPW